jgi:hypothetical protein
MQEFFNPLCLTSVALFATNNFFLKYQFPGWFTGKLSDFTACYFLPLYISAVLSLLSKWTLQQRLVVGGILTTLVFTLVKISALASDHMNTLFTWITTLFGFGPSLNIADPTDLIALPMIGIAYLVTIKKMGNPYETELA